MSLAVFHPYVTLDHAHAKLCLWQEFTNEMCVCAGEGGSRDQISSTGTGCVFLFSNKLIRYWVGTAKKVTTSGSPHTDFI